MANCLQLKKSNCKNCYKCIRNCPVKSIKFSGGQAQIIEDECILCGRCFVTCPQNAKEIRNDIGRVKEFIASNRPVYASIAPSYIVSYNGKSIASIEEALKKLGFSGVEETALGATIVKSQYEDMIKSKEKPVLISSCCHSANMLIQKYYPEALKYLADIMSPMQAHCSKIKNEHKDCLTVFIGPCISKKDEAEKYAGSVDCVLTFEELESWLDEENIVLNDIEDAGEKGRARLFPTAGGIIRSMNLENDYNYIAIDGVDNCIKALEDIIDGKLTNCFIEMSTCQGSCIGGPAINKERNNPISDFMAVNKITSTSDFIIDIPKRAELIKKIAQSTIQKQMPGSNAINEILIKMGKHSKEQELNCGSCGYRTCREKAAAVLMGKADLSMCLPFLKEKAESFSDNIINNTPNGIIVLNEQFEAQQINSAACKILNLRYPEDILGSPIVRILDPEDYFAVVANKKNIYEKRKYLAEYKKYIEETIIYDREFHIIISIMKDITEEENIRASKENQSKQAIEITDKVIEKQMRVVQEIASLLGETTAETKVALTKLKETLGDE